MHCLSIVIPCAEFDQHAEDTLVSVLQNRPMGCEIIVVTAGEYKDPYELTGEVRFVAESRACSVIDLINRGFDVADSDLVHVLRPGILATDGWTEPMFPHFADSDVAAVVPSIEHGASRRVWVGVGLSKWGSRREVKSKSPMRLEVLAPTVLAPSLAAGFYRRSTVMALGGFDPRMGTDCADIDLGLCLQQLNQRIVIETESRLLGDLPRGSEASVFQRRRTVERLYRRYRPQAFSHRLLHWLAAAGDVCSLAPRPQMLSALSGRLLAWCEPGAARRQAERLESARQTLDEATDARPATLRLESQRRLKAQSGRASQRRAA